VIRLDPWIREPSSFHRAVSAAASGRHHEFPLDTAPRWPFVTLIGVATTYLHPERLPGGELIGNVQPDYRDPKCSWNGTEEAAGDVALRLAHHVARQGRGRLPRHLEP
jgi:hypothetical protein